MSKGTKKREWNEDTNGRDQVGLVMELTFDGTDKKLSGMEL